MNNEDKKALLEHIKRIQMEMEFGLKDGKAHIGRIHMIDKPYFIVMVDLECSVFELVPYSELVSVKILTV